MIYTCMGCKQELDSEEVPFHELENGVGCNDCVNGDGFEIALEESELEEIIMAVTLEHLRTQVKLPNDDLFNWLEDNDVFQVISEAVFDLLEERGIFDEVEEIEEDEDEEREL